jgi:hypothetical protein
VLPLLRCRLSSLLLGTLLMHYTIAAPSAMSPASGVGRLPRSRETAQESGDCPGVGRLRLGQETVERVLRRLPSLGRLPCGNAYGNSRDIDLRRLR